MAKKILIAEDERDIAQMLGLRLEDHGFEVCYAYSGTEALEKAKSEKPDLILLDYTLPKIKGDAVCDELKSNAQYKHIRIILLSGYRKDQILGGQEADLYMGKPYEAHDLLRNIDELLAKTK